MTKNLDFYSSQKKLYDDIYIVSSVKGKKWYFGNNHVKVHSGSKVNSNDRSLRLHVHPYSSSALSHRLQPAAYRFPFHTADLKEVNKNNAFPLHILPLYKASTTINT